MQTPLMHYIGFFKKSRHYLCFAALSFATHAFLFAASYVLWNMNTPQKPERSLPAGTFLSATVSFVPMQSLPDSTSSDKPALPPAPKTTPYLKPASALQKKEINVSRTNRPTGSSLPFQSIKQPLPPVEQPSLVPFPTNSLPIYPEAAREEAIEAICPVKLIIQANGRVQAVLPDANGQNCLPIFFDSAKQALLSWQFQVNNAERFHLPIEITFPVTFKLT